MHSFEAYRELSFYTLNHGGDDFIHQHVVDAFTVQTADEGTPAMRLFFALAGLYLFAEKRCNGRQVQQMHQRMASAVEDYPQLDLPVYRGSLRIDVLLAPPGTGRDAKILEWAQAVWTACRHLQEQVARVLEPLL